MKAAWYERNGCARDVLQVGQIDTPNPSAGQVRVRLYAAGINPSDTKARLNSPLSPGRRAIPHQDGAGVVDAVGVGVPTSLIGERVWIYEAVVSGGEGCAAEYVCVPAANAVPLPDDVPFEVGACLGVPSLTAHRAVFADGPVHGQTLLITGGAGAVGSLAIQFAKYGGAKVVTTISNTEQAQIARASGADVVINRSSMDLASHIREALGESDDRCVDRIVDVAFGSNLDVSLEILKQNGIIAAYSSDAKPEPVIPFFPLLRLGATIRFVFVYSMSAEAHHLASTATSIGLRQGWLQTKIAARFSLEQIVEANEFAESGKGIGKTVVLIA